MNRGKQNVWANCIVVDPYLAFTDPGNEGYGFEWNIRSDLQIGVDYYIQGSSDLSFNQLENVTDFTVISVDPVSNGSGPAISRVRIKVPTTEERYFLRLTNLAQEN